ncbi:MAG: hypothetical protein ABIT70_15365 [Sulfuriferula sp.]
MRVILAVADIVFFDLYQEKTRKLCCIEDIQRKMFDLEMESPVRRGHRRFELASGEQTSQCLGLRACPYAYLHAPFAGRNFGLGKAARRGRYSSMCRPDRFNQKTSEGVRQFMQYPD